MVPMHGVAAAQAHSQQTLARLPGLGPIDRRTHSRTSTHAYVLPRRIRRVYFRLIDSSGEQTFFHYGRRSFAWLSRWRTSAAVGGSEGSS